MIIDKKYKIEKVCGDETRCSIAHPWVDDGALIVTNGRALAIIPVDDEYDMPGPIPLAAIKDAQKNHAGIMTVSEDTVTVGGNRYPKPEVSPPSYKSILPSLPEPSSGETVEIGLTPGLLLALTEAMGGNKNTPVKLRVKLKDNAAPMEVRTITITKSDSDSLGILMPARL